MSESSQIKLNMEDITMAKTISMTCERKEGRKWVETYASTNAEHCYQMYAGHLYDKYIAKAPYIKRVTDQCNYDGTRTITFYQTNDYRTTYIIPR